VLLPLVSLSLVVLPLVFLPLGGPPPWWIGLATTVLAGMLLWSVTGRLRLAPETRAASTAAFACGALLSVVAADGVDGRATLLLAAAGVLAAAGPRRSAVAALAGLGAVVLAPVVGVGLLVLLGVMALTGDLAARVPAVVRRAAGWAAIGAAVATCVLLARSGTADAVPPTVAAPLVAAALLVSGVLWIRLPWIRPAAGAVGALAACLCVPGIGPDAVLPVTAGVAVLAAVLAEEYRRLFARPRLVVGTMAGVVAGALLVPALLVSTGAFSSPASPLAAPAVSGPAAVQPGQEPPPIPSVVRPVSIAIPALQLTGPLAELSVAPDGELLAPADPGLAGWYAGGVVPGDLGPAVIGGHVDSRRGPGVFFSLRSLQPGDAVEVTRSDGQVVRFAVTGVREVSKAQFPTGTVYAPTPRPELRLITCGGAFDWTARSYTDNLVVEATAL
jgi:hypothetical protein